MRTGQILAAIGALLTLIAVLALPMFEIPQQNPAMAMEVGPGLWLALTAALVVALTAAGYFLHRARLFAAINVVLAGFLVSLAIYLGLNAPFLFQASHQLPFDMEATPAKFIGFMTGAAGLYLLWIGVLTTLAGSLMVSISQPRYGKDTRFLRLAMLWRDDIIKEMVVEDPRNITVGEGVGNDFIVSGTPTSHTLFKFVGGKASSIFLRVAQGFEGRVHLEGKTNAASDFVGKDASVKDGDWGVLRFGENSLFFQMIKPANLVGNKFFGDFDPTYSSTVLLSLVVQAGFLIYVAIAPMDVNYASRSKDAFTQMIRIETRHVDAEKEKKKKEEELERLKKEEAKKEEEKVPEEVPEEQPPMPDKPIEKAGDPLKKDIDITDLKNRNQLKPLKDDHKGLDAKRDQLSLDKKQGMVAVLKNKSRKKSALSSVLGKQKNLVAKNAVWGEDGDFVMENEGQSDLSYEGGSLTTGDYGGGGLGGAGGFGDGGGGGGFGGGGAFGMGGMGGVGGLGGIGGADASRAGRMALAGLKDKGRARASRVSMGTGGVSGFCKKQDVLKTVQRRAAAIRSCYEVALQLNPDLKGKIVVKWTINLDGKVEGVQTVSNNLNNKKVEECMAKVIGHMRFKKPSGGICIIKWPFVFSSASGEE